MWRLDEPFKPAKSFRVFCPVCNGWLGSRTEKMVFSGHCEECHATFVFSPGTDKPTATLDSDKPRACTCQSCRTHEVCDIMNDDPPQFES